MGIFCEDEKLRGQLESSVTFQIPKVVNKSVGVKIIEVCNGNVQDFLSTMDI